MSHDEAALRSGSVGRSRTGVAPARRSAETHAGKTVVPPDTVSRDDRVAGDRPGKSAGLSVREAEVLITVTAGYSNAEIAAASYLSVSTIKTHIHPECRTLGVSRRAQAVGWGMRNAVSLP